MFQLMNHMCPDPDRLGVHEEDQGHANSSDWFTEVESFECEEILSVAFDGCKYVMHITLVAVALTE